MSRQIRVSPEFADMLDRFTAALNQSLPDKEKLSPVEGSRVLNSLIGQSGVVVLKKSKGRQKILDMRVMEDIYL